MSCYAVYIIKTRGNSNYLLKSSSHVKLLSCRCRERFRYLLQLLSTDDRNLILSSILCLQRSFPHIKRFFRGIFSEYAQELGGLKFSGLTYMSDAIQVAGEILAHSFDEQRFLIVFSDGWPYSYPNISSVLSKSVNSLEKKGVIVIRVGLESERMKNSSK